MVFHKIIIPFISDNFDENGTKQTGFGKGVFAR
jgi:hypothetical protein